MIRLAKPEDFDFIDSIALSSYPNNYYEGSDSFRSKVIGYPEGCFVCEIESKIVGYIISFPYLLWEHYPINEIYKPIENADCHYIHDLCVDKEYRKRGYGLQLVDSVLRIKSNPKVLMSVLDSSKFWEKIGFQSQKTVDYYGAGSCYMIRC